MLAKHFSLGLATVALASLSFSIALARHNTICIAADLIPPSERANLRNDLNFESIVSEIFSVADAQEEAHANASVVENGLRTLSYRGIPYSALKPILLSAKHRLDLLTLEPYERFHSLHWISVYHATNRDFENALAIVRELEAIAWSNAGDGMLTGSGVAEEIGQSLSFVVSAYISAGDFDSAEQVVEKMNQAGIARVPTPDHIQFEKGIFFYNGAKYRKAVPLFQDVVEHSNNSVLVRVAYELIAMAKKELSEDIGPTIAELVQYTNTANFDNFKRWRMLLQTAATLSNLGRTQQAVDLAKVAEQLVRSEVERPKRQTLAGDLVTVAGYYGDFERGDLAKKLLAEATTLVVEQGQTFNGFSPQRSLAVIAASLAQAGYFEGARQTLASLEGVSERTLVLLAIVDQAISNDELDIACQAIRETTAVNFSLADTNDKGSWNDFFDLSYSMGNIVSVMSELATAQHKTATHDQPYDTLSGALKLTRVQPDSRTKASSLANIAGTISTIGQSLESERDD